MDECARLIDGVSFETTNRLRVAVSLLHLCVEHQKGIHVLVDHGFAGSAFALVRPQFEAYVRGVWFHRCATEAQVADFLSGGEPPKINTLLEALEKVDAFSDGRLTMLKSAVWRNLNDFTHGGAIQVKARNTPDEIVGNYRPEHVSGLLQTAATLSFLGGVAIAAAVANVQMANEMLTVHNRLYRDSIATGCSGR
jgi:hypothetical protein